MTSLAEIENRFISWAQSNPDFRAAVVVGSQARVDHPADPWSDLDLVLFILQVEKYQESMDWIEALAPVWVSMSSRTAGGEPERLVLYAGGFQVDFVFHEAADLAGLARQVQSGQSPEAIQRGVRVLFDKDQQIPELPPPVRTHLHEPPNAHQFMDAWERFWFSAVYAGKQLRRGDLAFYKSTEHWLRGLLLPFLEWHTQGSAGWGAEPWHNGRFIAEWLDPALYSLLAQSYTSLETGACWHGLTALVRCFQQAARGAASSAGLAYPEGRESDLTAYLNQLRPGNTGE